MADSSQVKLGAAIFGGYLLGRTKKGGMALRLATRMAMSGSNVTPQEMVRGNAQKLIQSPETQAIIMGLRAQLVQVAQAAFDARVQALAQNLTDRTEALKKPTEAAGDTAGEAGDTVKGSLMSLVGGDAQDEEGSEEPPPEEDEAAQDPGDDEEPEAPEEGDREEGDGEEEPDDEYENRVAELRRKHLRTLQRMARKLYEDDAVDGADKNELAEMIADAEAEDEDEGGDEEEQGEPEEAEEPEDEEPEEEPEPEPAPAKKTAKKTAKKSTAKKTAKKASR